MSTFTYSAADIAKALGKSFAPSPEQTRIIQAPLESNIVIAGAGSGKTETMANRVVFLIANGWVSADQVLGMTFTRKAANELASRVRENLAALKKSNLEILGDSGDDMFGATITTYNAYANRIYADYAHLIGRDPDAQIMSEASAWQLARSIVETAGREDMLALDEGLEKIADGLLDLARALSDNMCTIGDLTAFGEQFIEAVSGTDVGSLAKSNQSQILSALNIAAAYPHMDRLIAAYEEAKQKRGLMEFSDQVARACEIADKFPFVAQAIQGQYKVVLLDEYQDTSNVQIRLLSTIFRGLCVSAVGDPNQAIYGWRGASASSMDTRNFFNAYAPSQANRQVFDLPQSWRNPEVVLNAANAIARELASDSPDSPVELKVGSADNTGTLSVHYPETLGEEATFVAEWFKNTIAEWAPRPGVGKDLDEHKKPLTAPTAALLVRRIADLDPFKRALEAADVPYRVVGLGGLLVDPLIVDLICALRVMHFTNAESELIKLLSGPRWQIAPRDLKALSEAANWLGKHDYARTALDEKVVARLRSSVAADDKASLVDALDFLTERKTRDHGALDKMSDEGFARMRAAGELFAALRRRAGLDLRELVTVVIQELNLDIEGEANDTSASTEPVISAFMGAVSTFLATSIEPTLGAFLKWLEDAEERDRMSPASAEPEPGVVQLMTIHGAKGLEWHLVAVPRQSQIAKATITKNGKTWLDFGTLPDDLKADSGELLPAWKWESSPDWTALKKSYDEWKQGTVDRAQAEQRRLAYVAVTRSMQHLLVTGSFWASGTSARQPNEYLLDIAATNPSITLPEGSIHESLPENAQQLTVTWPLPALGLHRGPRVEAAANLVRTSQGEPSGAINEDITLLLAERDAQSNRQDLSLPVRVPASKFKDFVETPDKVAQALKRPMPSEPYRATMLGTIFHAWVETVGKSGQTLPGLERIAEDLTVDLSEVDGDVNDGSRNPQPVAVSPVDEEKLAKLQQTFLASEWGGRPIHETELEIQLPLGPNIVICKIDAIYKNETPSGVRFEIVDWKTGAAPSDAHDLEVRQYQLALYRLAYATWANIPIEDIDAAFYFVAHDLVVRPQKIMGREELLELWSKIY